MENNLLWIIVTSLLGVSGTLLLLVYKSLVKRLDEIKLSTCSLPGLQTKMEGIERDIDHIKLSTACLPAIETKISVMERDIDRHEDKLDDLQKSKVDKPGI